MQLHPVKRTYVWWWQLDGRQKKKKVVPQHSSSNQIYSMTRDVFTWFTLFLLPRFIPKAAVISLNNEIDRPHLFSYLGNKSRGACTTLWATAIILGDATIEFGWMGLSVSEDRQIQADWYLETFFFHRGGTGVSQPCIQMLLLFMRGWHLSVRYLGERMNASDWLKNVYFQVYSE